MGAADYWHYAFACPFFDFDTVDTIGCEGGITIRIPDKQEFRQFAKGYCCSVTEWDKCPIAKAITAIKYTKEMQTK